ncbi:MAG: DUF4623 domain-containing protein [Bacteroidota bacterium]
MKKTTIASLMMLMMTLSISLSAHANNKESIFDDITTILEKNTAQGNLPAIIDDHGANRGASFNGQYLFVASRQGGNNIYYWDVNDPDGEPQQLNMTDVSGGTFTINDVKTVGNHIFACNMVMPGVFKVYHWDGMDVEPTVLIEYDSGTARIGDAITVIGNPDSEAMILASRHGGNNYYAWYMNEGVLESADPEVFTVGDLDNTNFSRVTFSMDEEMVPFMSGPGGLALLGETIEGVITVELLVEQSFFPGWPMYVNVFEYNGGRYLSFIHVKDNPAENMLYVLDITEGETTTEALQLLNDAVFADRVVHSYDLGSVSNGNASVGLDIVIDNPGNLWLMGYAAGNGFVVQKVGEEGYDGLPLPFAETFDGLGEETPDTWLPEGWLSVDNDGDNFNWYWSSGPTFEPNGQMRSESAYQDEDSNWQPLTPDNWLITPKLYLNNPTGDEIVQLSFKVGTGAVTPDFKQENYSVLISVTDTEPGSFTSLWTETLSTDLPQNELQLRTLDLSDYAGQDVFIAFRHHDVTDMDRLLLDDVMVEVTTPQVEVRDLTLNVKMRVWAEEFEIFNPEADFVDVAGTFNEWGETPLILTALDDEDLTYTITIPDLEVGETYNFKFRINGSWDDETAEFPSGGPEREVTIAETDNEYTYWYNDDIPSVVNQLAEVQLNIFPNPAKDVFTVTSSEVIQRLVISDITGRMISNIPVNAQESRIDISDFLNGIYLIGVYTENGVTVNKLQIQK